MINNDFQSVLIIAEAGVNHNGSIAMAEEIIAEAAKSGADIVKFQTFKADAIASKTAPKAAYQVATTGDQQSQYDMLKALELSEQDHRHLQNVCEKHGVEFLSSPFDNESADFLVKSLGLRHLKIGSGEITNAPFLLNVARLGVKVTLSTGMSTLIDVEEALGVLAFGYLAPQDRLPGPTDFVEAFMSEAGQDVLKQNVTLLHCTTEYPAAYETVNMRAMDTLAAAFDLRVGLSDHTPGTAIPIAAVARGALVIEKHFTLDRTLPGPDQHASLEPHDFAQMVEGIRAIEVALGSPVKRPAIVEIGNRAVARKSLVALANIEEGQIFTVQNLGVKRPGTGIAPSEYWAYLGQPARRSYRADELIQGQ